jgi:HAD superfamily hydrolase (TIGR01484 family)
MPASFRVIAVDYDGTIAESDRPNEAVLSAIAELRRRGRRILLCTGRILEELLEVFPDVERHFDAIVAENGAVVAHKGQIDTQQRQLSSELVESLRAEGIPFRSGHVLIATDAVHDSAILECIRRHGLDAQLVYNRSALMVLPEGVSKGTGMVHALGRLELSRHSTIAIGDAENDHSLLQAAEIGVAVGNAVPALKAHADICLEGANGDAVAAFLRGPVLEDTMAVQPARYSVTLGRDAKDSEVGVPGSRMNVLIAGASGAGKSYVTGLLVERLVALDYTVCVLDAEGDHSDLETLPGVLAVGGTETLPSPERLATMVRNRFSSVIADLSLLAPEQKRSYCTGALAALERLRQQRGYPHWIVIEEADQLLFGSPLPTESGPTGYCLVTHRPGTLHERALAAMDAVIALPGAERHAHVPPTGESEHGQPFTLSARHALLATQAGVTELEFDARLLRHVRHRHKYAHAQVPPERRFFFRANGSSRRTAGNMSEFRSELRRSSEQVLRAHLQAGDFSRWIRDVLADDELGRRVREVERWFRADSAAAPDGAVEAIITAIDVRYECNTGAAP